MNAKRDREIAEEVERELAADKPRIEQTVRRTLLTGVAVALATGTFAEPEAARRREQEPVALPLICPRCRNAHVDEGEWATPARAHRTHLCAHCGCEWRPFDFPTIGLPDVFHEPARSAGAIGGLRAREAGPIDDPIKDLREFIASAWRKPLVDGQRRSWMVSPISDNTARDQKLARRAERQRRRDAGVERARKRTGGAT